MACNASAVRGPPVVQVAQLLRAMKKSKLRKITTAATARAEAAEARYLAALARAEAAEARLLELENAITWGTSCLSCSAFLDRANAERERAERAEARLAAITDACRSIPSPIANRILAIISEEVHLGG